MNHLISVIVPIYSVEKYLPKCIDSILSQTHSNLEVILVDDGSPDSCPEICDEYAKKDSRIKVIHKSNGGLSSARNAGIEIATGDYIGLIDSDDFIDKHFYEHLLSLALEHDADIAQCSFIKVPEDNIDSFQFAVGSSETIISSDNIGALAQLFSEDFDTYVNTVVVWNKLYKASLFKDVRYPLGKISEDEFTTYKLLYLCNKFVTTNYKLHAYVQRKSSIMGRQFSAKRFDVLDAYEEALLFFDKHKLYEIELKCLERYLKSILEFILKTYKSGSSEIDSMIHTLSLRFSSLKEKIVSFLSLHPEFHEKNSDFYSLFNSCEEYFNKAD